MVKVRWRRLEDINLPGFVITLEDPTPNTTSTITHAANSTLPQPSLTPPSLTLPLPSLHTTSTITHVNSTITHTTSTITHNTSTFTHMPGSTLPQPSLPPHYLNHHSLPHYLNHHSQPPVHTTSIITHKFPSKASQPSLTCSSTLPQPSLTSSPPLYLNHHSHYLNHHSHPQYLNHH